MTNVKYEPDAALKETKLVDLKENIAPFYFDKLEFIAGENNGHMALGRVCERIFKAKEKVSLCTAIVLSLSVHLG